MAKNKIKILFTIPNFDTAGSGKVLYDLAKNLDKNRFEVSIACRNSKGIFFKEVESLGLPIYFLETTVNYKPFFSFFNRIKPFKEFIKQNNFDIVHSWHWSSDWTEIISTRLGGAKFIFTKKAMSWGNIHWKIKSYLANFIITINHEMIDFYPYKKNQQLIPLGLDVTYYNPDFFEKEVNLRFFKIITVANLVPVKGIEVLIKAIKLTNEKSIVLDILGDDRDPYVNDLKKLIIELELESQIRFLGKKLDVRPFIKNSDLYIIPTLNEGRKEGMPMALVEAMSMSIPVLGSNISGINFVLKDFTNLLFEPGNEKELSKKISFFYTMNEEERNKVGKLLRDYTVTNFTIEKCILQHEELYKRILEK
jgi:glycosyltransferase involved in cell wall biosynthesis